MIEEQHLSESDSDIRSEEDFELSPVLKDTVD